MINNKLLLFKTQEAFERNINNIRTDAVVFIQSPKRIYLPQTHEYWDCTGKEGLNLDIKKIINDYDIATKTWVKQWVAENVKPGQNDNPVPSTVYVAGEGINMTGSTISLNAATSSTLGGIKIGFNNGVANTAAGNYPVRLDGNNKAYVHVDIPQSTPGEPSATSSNYYEIMFTNTDGEQPSLPQNDPYNRYTWRTYAVNPTGSEVVWMISRVIINGVAGDWEGPWRISGPNGENGIDGDTQEFIYKLWMSEDPTTFPVISYLDNNGKTRNDDDFVPAGWTDSPTGIDSQNKYELMAMRFKTHSKANPEGTWSDFTNPVVWSAYGKNGMDGDGVEYIFYSSDQAPTEDPSTWTNDTNFQTEREYIRRRSSTDNPHDGRRIANRWQDDPCDIYTKDDNNFIFQPGTKTWVSIRRRRTVNGVTSWEGYSKPAIWSVYTKDGDAGIGVVADFDNDTMCVPLKEDGLNYQFLQTSELQMYNGASKITCSGQIATIQWSNGTTIPEGNWSNIASFTGGNHEILQVIIRDGILDFEHNGTLCIVVNATATISGATVTRSKTLQVVGVHFGTDGASFSLKTNTNVIRKNKIGNKSPLTIDCQCAEIKGSSSIRTWSPGNIPEDRRAFSFTYVIDDAADEQPLAGPLSTTGINDNVVIRLKYDNGVNTVVVDQETIHVIEDGLDGRFVPMVRYNVEIESYEAKKFWKTPNNVWYFGLNATWRIYRKEGENSDEITPNNASTYGVTSYIKYGNVSSPIDYQITNRWHSEYTYSWDDKYLFGNLVVLEGGVQVASYLIPTAIIAKDGKDGEAAQALQAAVMRLTEWNETPGHAYNSGDTAENGVKYLDVVQFGNELYKCLYTHTPNETPIGNGNAWQKPYVTTVSETGAKITTYDPYWSLIPTMGDAAFNVLMANYLSVNSLTAEQIVIKGEQNTIYAGLPVAGMVNGTYVKEISQDQVDNGIRIFAGTIPENGNIVNTAFNVDQEGNVNAGGTSQKSSITHKIEFDNDGSGHVANGNIAWDADGNITAFGVNPFIGGSTQLVNQAYKNMLFINKIVAHTGPQSLEVSGLIISNGWIVAPFKVTCINVHPILVSNLEGYTITAQMLFDCLCGANSPFYNSIRKSDGSGYIYNQGDDIWIEIPDEYFCYRKLFTFTDEITNEQSSYYQDVQWKPASSGFVTWHDPF